MPTVTERGVYRQIKTSETVMKVFTLQTCVSIVDRGNVQLTIWNLDVKKPPSHIPRRRVCQYM